jgi:hypothetical protein
MVLAFMMSAMPKLALAQLNQNCIVSVLNRTVQVNADGSWVLPNIPANFGQVKARATCVQNGVTTFGESAFFTVPANGAVNLPAITLGSTSPIPISLLVTATNLPLTTAGQTVQLVVTATYSDGSTKNVNLASAGTTYTTSNAAVASTTVDGLVTAVASGTVVIQATNDGATGIISVPIVLGGNSVGGIPVSWLIANHLNQFSPTIASEDPDRDGLTNLQEFQIGTDPNNPDTDGDALKDGDEVNVYHTNPLLTDTDGDLIPDGVEVQTGTNPTDRNSYDLKKATASSIVKPSSFTLSTSVVTPNVSQQLTWSVTLIDGKTTLDLTFDPRTNYSSSNLQVCNFGGQAGQVFAGSVGTCTITISQNTLSITATGTVQSFTPSEVSTFTVSNAVAVDVAGNFAYVGRAANGLTIIDVTNRMHPLARGSVTGIGDAEAVRVSAPYAFVADANGFLRVVQIQNPDAPTLVASLPIAGKPIGLALHSNLIAVAALAGGVSLIDITNPLTPVTVSTVGTPAPAIGVDFDLQHGLAAVAMGTAGVQVVDISIAALPRLRGLLSGGSVHHVLLQFPAVLLADTQRSVTAVNITNPDQPVISSSMAANLGGAPVDIASFAGIAITADTSFGRAIPVINVSNPLQPISLAFLTPSSPAFGSSIAMDASFGYLIMSTNSTLRIYQYRQIIDQPGTPPTIQISSPITGTTVIQGSTLTVAANAVDDVGVASVTFFINGQSVSTTSQVPYQYIFQVPATGSMLTIGAVATDFANDTGSAPTVTLNVIPDPLTTAVGRVVDIQNNPISGATVSTLGFTVSSLADGTFTLPGLPTIQGPIAVTVSAMVNGIQLGGLSTAVAPVLGGVTNIGNVTAAPIPIISSMNIKSALFNAVIPNLAVVGLNLGGAKFSFPGSGITVTSSSIGPLGTSATLSLTVGSQVGTFALVATNSFGSSSSTVSANNRLTVVDPNSTALGGNGVPAVIDATFGVDPLDPNAVLIVSGPRETETVPLSVLNGDVASGAARETESTSLSVLNGTVSAGAARETESLSLSVLNASVSSGALRETESLPLSVLNSAVSAGAARETESLPLSVLNGAVSAGAARETESKNFSVENSGTTALLTLPQGQPRSQVSQEPLGGQLPGAVDGGQTSNPSLDSDGDGLPDWVEYLIGTDPYNPDTDGDGLSDGEEILIHHTNPLNPDTDGDGYSDGEEVNAGSNPLDPLSTPVSRHDRASIGRNQNFAVDSPRASKQGDDNVQQNQSPTRPILASKSVRHRSVFPAVLFKWREITGAKSTLQ